MNDIFKDIIREGWIIIYMNNILIHSRTQEKQHQRTKQVLQQRLLEHNLFLKLKKYSFNSQEVEYLECIITPGRVAMNSVKVEEIKHWLEPKTVK